MGPPHNMLSFLRQASVLGLRLMLFHPCDCRMTVRQFAWASHEQGGPFIIYDASEGLVYVDRQYVLPCLRAADAVVKNSAVAHTPFTSPGVHETYKPHNDILSPKEAVQMTYADVCTCHVCSVSSMLAAPHSSAAKMVETFVGSLFGRISSTSLESKVSQAW